MTWREWKSVLGDFLSYSIDKQHPPFLHRLTKIGSNSLEATRDFREECPILWAIRATVTTRMENAQVFRAVVEHHNTVRPHSALAAR